MKIMCTNNKPLVFATLIESICTIAAFFAIPSPCAYATIEQSMVIIEDEAKPFFEHVQKWLKNLHTLKGEYTLEVYDPESADPIKLYTQEYRYGGDKRRYLSTTFNIRGADQMLYMAMLDGDVSHLFAELTDNEDASYSGRVKHHWPIPRGVFLNPMDPFGRGTEGDMPLDHVMPTVYKYFQRNGFHVLSKWSEHNSQDYWIDQDMHIVRIDYVSRPLILMHRSFFEHLQAKGIVLGFNLNDKTGEWTNLFIDFLKLWDDDPFHMRFMRYFYEFDNYTAINNYSFPLWIKRNGCAQRDGLRERLDSLKSDYDNNKISFLQFDLLRNAGDFYSCQPSSYQLLQFTSPDEIVINAELPDTDFMLPFQEGIPMYNAATGEHYTYESPKWYASLRIVPVSVILGLCIVVLVVGYGTYHYVTRQP